ncbi:MAG: DUF3040 domain-containing protein [Acidimicrobiales bacterium]
MPLSEEEQRILTEIEQQFYESDPAFARGVGKTTLYRHAGRNLKYAGLGFFGGFAVLVVAFTSSLLLGFAGFLVMLGSAFVFERNLRKMGRAGLAQITGTIKTGHVTTNVKEYFGDAGKRLRQRFKRED